MRQERGNTFASFLDVLDVVLKIVGILWVILKNDVLRFEVHKSGLTRKLEAIGRNQDLAWGKWGSNGSKAGQVSI
jgi:hypothetical protein